MHSNHHATTIYIYAGKGITAMLKAAIISIVILATLTGGGAAQIINRPNRQIAATWRTA